MKVFITGGSGLIGSRLARKLAAGGDEAVVLTRSAERARKKLGDGFAFVEGDPTEPGDWQQAVSGCDAVVNLAGESIADKRWSADQKQRLRESRFRCTDHCVEAIAAADLKPRAFVSGSAIGYYGFTGEDELGEDAPPGDDFLAQLCVEWEKRARPAADAGVRTVHARTGIVLAPSGGALSAMLFPFKMFVGGPILPGTQYMSWIHVDDVVGGILHAIDSDLEGPVNLTAPNPVTNRDFSAALGRALGRPSWLPVPRFGLRVLFGEIAEILTTGQRVVPAKALAAGYAFKHPDLDAALQDLLKRD